MEDIYISNNRRNSGNFVVNIPQQPMPPMQLPDNFDPPPPEKKKKRKGCGCLILSVIAVIPLVLVLGFNSLFCMFIASSGYTRNDLVQNEYISDSQLRSSSAVTNILFLGVDGDAESSSRSDSMILVSVDYAHRKIKLTSFLRDSWVYIPSKGKNAKLNAACTYGGPQLVADTIEYNFGINIDHYVMVDFEMFTNIIDCLGGVDVEVTEKEADFINRTTRQTVDYGESVHLNGEEALVYCRIRKLDSDYNRTLRQRKVISALIEQAKTAGISKIIQTMKDVFPLIQTDMSVSEINKLVYKAGFAVLTFDIQQNRVPTDEHMYPDTINGQWVEVLDIEATKNYLIEFIYTDNIVTDEDE